MINIYKKIILKLITEQELIIGPFAWEEASRVSNLKIIDKENGVVEIIGDANQVIDALVSRYDKLFGRASHEVSHDAVSKLVADLAPEQIPVSLR